MRVLNLSLDGSIFERDSALQRRLVALAEKAGEITVFVPAGNDMGEQISSHLFARAAGGAKPIQFLKLWRAARRALSERKYDLITVQDAYLLALLAYLLARRFRIPLEVQVHGLEKFYGIHKWIGGFVLRRANKVRVVSERLKEFLTTNYQLPTTNLYVLPVYTQVSRKQGRTFLPTQGSTFPERPFTFLTVGRLVPVKNIGLQIRAMAEVVKEFPQTRLVVVGDGPLETRLKLQVESCQLEERVIFEGKRREPAKYYQEADAFLLTSDYEGWGLAVTEAAAYALPIIMTDVGLAGEFVRDGENGLVIPVGNGAALVSAMRRVITDGALRRRLGDAARRAFRSLPSPEEQIKKQVAKWKGFR